MKANPFPAVPFLSLVVGDGVRLPRVRVMRGVWERGIGLMGRRAMPPGWGDALLFPECRDLHTFGMRFALDVCFLDVEGQSVELRRNLPPGRLVFGPRGARHVLEAPAGLPPLEGRFAWIPCLNA